MPRRVSLPMSFDPRMTLARARERLGGRAFAGVGVGVGVRVGESVGVVIWGDDSSCDVWLGEDRTQRVKKELVTIIDVDAEMAPVAADARAFAAIDEGAEVFFDADKSGKLVEKCRWGGLVARADGKIFAVGFRRFARKS